MSETNNFAELRNGVYFVSGIDTDAGKTMVTGWLAKCLMESGRKVVTVKPIQTGADCLTGDISVHRKIMGITLPEDAEGLTCPVLFKYPASPHLAAELDGRTIDFERIDRCIAALAEKYDIVLVEGAGGLMVPLTRDLLTIDYAKSKGWPMIFITGGKLGSVNHTLLSFEAMQARSMQIAAVAYNDWCANKDPVISNDTKAFIRSHTAKRLPDALWLECPTLNI